MHVRNGWWLGLVALCACAPKQAKPGDFAEYDWALEERTLLNPKCSDFECLGSGWKVEKYGARLRFEVVSADDTGFVSRVTVAAVGVAPPLHQALLNGVLVRVETKGAPAADVRLPLDLKQSTKVQLADEKVSCASLGDACVDPRRAVAGQGVLFVHGVASSSRLSLVREGHDAPRTDATGVPWAVPGARIRETVFVQSATESTRRWSSAGGYLIETTDVGAAHLAKADRLVPTVFHLLETSYLGLRRKGVPVTWRGLEAVEVPMFQSSLATQFAQTAPVPAGLPLQVYVEGMKSTQPDGGPSRELEDWSPEP